MQTNNLIVAGLDFNQIKDNLKTYLKNNSDFTDYNFDGSTLSTLINLLAYNTQYNAFYLNMVANDMFIDTAVLRDSIISHAKSLGYTPRSAVGAKADISINLIVPDTQNAPNQILLKKSNRFETNTRHSFYPIKDYVATRIQQTGSFQYIFENVTLTEGSFVQKRFTVSKSFQRFILENENIDSSTIEVFVFATPTANNFTKFNNALNIVDVKHDSTVFFLQEKNNGYIEIYFGDNIIGKTPDVGGVVVVTYLVTDTDKVNGSRNIFFADSSIDTLELTNAQINAGITLNERIDGGAAPESIESIRLRAPRHYASQFRTVTEDDFVFHIENVYPNVDSVKVWGGQNNDPPYYGKVFISIKPKGSLVLTDFEKETIKKAIENRSIVTLIPEIVDPEYVNLIIETTFKFNSNLTSESSVSLSSFVKNGIFRYCEEKLNAFDSILRFSRLVSFIDDIDASILSNSTTIKLRKDYNVLLNESNFFHINFSNSIIPGTLISNKFTINDPNLPPEENFNLFFKDNKNGNIDLYNTTILGEKILRENVGRINYETGVGLINDIKINKIYAGNKLEIFMFPVKRDVSSVQNRILTISENDIITIPLIEII